MTVVSLIGAALLGFLASAPELEHADSAPQDTVQPEAKNWSASISVFSYVVPEERDYVQPTINADLDWLHLEARYNYESFDAGSVWVGYNFSGGEKLAWELTPMVGTVFGDFVTVAPGYKGSISWWKLELYSEGEFVINPLDPADRFFYNWSELTLSPLEWLRFGMVTQRTLAYDTDRDVQRGLLLGFSWKKVDLTGYVFNPDDGDPIWVIAVTLNF